MSGGAATMQPPNNWGINGWLAMILLYEQWGKYIFKIIIQFCARPYIAISNQRINYNIIVMDRGIV